MSDDHRNNLMGMPPTRLPEDPAASAMAAGSSARSLVPAHPASSLVWATLAQEALTAGDAVAAYAFARTGYHRGLDQLRRAGWRGQGPIPWEHEPNRGFLRALAALARAAGALGETDEQLRCATFLRDSSRLAADILDIPA